VPGQGVGDPGVLHGLWEPEGAVHRQYRECLTIDYQQLQFSQCRVKHMQACCCAAEQP
jgi:hypothetical protein